jgi:hypothetical protein
MLFGSQKSRKKLMDTKSSMSNRMKFKQEREREREREQNRTRKLCKSRLLPYIISIKKKKKKVVNFSLETPPPTSQKIEK